MVHVWPQDDLWDQGAAGTYGTHSTGYIRTRAWLNNASVTDWETSLLFAGLSSSDHLYSGHFYGDYASAYAGPFSAKNKVAVATGVDANLYGWTFRNLVQGAVDVSALFKVILQGPPFLYGSVRHIGIGARISGAISNPDSQALEALNATDGYWFVRGAGEGDPTGPNGTTGNYRYYLLRCISGVITLLAQSTPGAYADISDGRYVKLRMSVVNDASTNVEIVCYAKIGNESEAVVLAYTDSSGSKITTAGRVAFATTGEQHAVGTSESLAAHGCVWFQCKNYAGSTLYFRDEWERTKLSDGLLVQGRNYNAGDYPGEGYSLACGWTGDLYSCMTNAGTVTSKWLDYNSSPAGTVFVQKDELRTEFNYTAFFWHQRPATSPTDQHRSIDVQWPTKVGTGIRTARLCLRESGSDYVKDTPMKRGYLFNVARDDSDDTVIVQLQRRHNGSPSAITIGGNVTTETITEGVTYELQMEVINVASGPIGEENAVRIKCYIDGVQVVFNQLTPPIDGITVQGDGTVYDETSNRVTSGFGEGFGVNMSSALCDDTDQIIFNDFEVGGSAGDSTLPEDQVGIAIADEADGGTGTLLVPADWPVEMTSEFRVLRHEFEADYTYTASRAPFQRRRWRLTARAIELVDRNALLTFWNAHGVETPFAWTTDEGESVTVHFVDDAMATALINPAIYNFDFELEELHGSFVQGDDAQHLVLIVLDDPPPLSMFQRTIWGYNPNDDPTIPAATDVDITSQNLYPATPTLQAMADAGLIFTRAVNTAVCSPGRASIQTGAYAHHHGLGSIVRADRSVDPLEVFEFGETNYNSNLVDYTPTGWGGSLLADMLNDTSVYPDVHLGFIGKMHFSLDAVGTPAGLEWTIIDRASESALGRLGDWDRRVVMVNNHNNHPIPDAGGAGQATSNPGNGSHYFYRYRDEITETNSGTIQSPGSGRATNANSGTDINAANLWSTTRFINEAVSFMNAIPEGKRAFLYLPLTLAHSPFDSAPYSLITTSEYKDMGPEATEDLNLVTVWKRQLGMMEAVDSEIARLRSEMDADVLAKTTFIVVADNGVDPTFVNGALNPTYSGNATKNFGTNWATLNTYDQTPTTYESRFKSAVYHYGVASQVIMSGAGVKNGGRTSTALCDISVDLYPTIAEYFGIDPDTLVTDGQSLFRLMADQTSDAQHPRTHSFTYHWYPNGTLSDIDTNVLAWNSATTYGAGATCAWNHYHWSSNAGGNVGNEPGVAAGWTQLDVTRDLVVRMTLTGMTTPAAATDAQRNGTFVMHKFLGGTDGQAGKGVLRELYHAVNPDGTLDDFQELSPLTATAGDSTTYIAQLQQLEIKMNAIISAVTPGAQGV